MKTLCIASCGKSKIWDKQPQAGPMPARSVYVGPFSGACGRYADKFFPDSWCILSAKYGFVFPDDLIPASYNVSFNDRRSKPISADDLCRQAQEKGLLEYDRIVVMGGANYRKMMAVVFEGKQLVFPLEGMKAMGPMIGWMNQAVRKGESFLID